MEHLFITGMLRSGTSLIQTILSNHRQLFIAYQPFYQLYVDIKQLFFKEHDLKMLLPLGDGMDSSESEDDLFQNWLMNRHFDTSEVSKLTTRSTLGKGASAPELSGKLLAKPGSFIDIHKHLHALLADHYRSNAPLFIGAKEVLCEEYVPAFVRASQRCILIGRDPRAVIASASHGRYKEETGDRYPLLMLIRLWRKSVAYWIALSTNPFVYTVRYEDLTSNSVDSLRKITEWLEVEPFHDGIIGQPLLNHAGEIWRGNSSFGDKSGIEQSSREIWRTLLTGEEIRFIEACTKPELALLGYPHSDNLQRADISDFIEDVREVRESYLSTYQLSSENIKLELARWDAVERNQFINPEGSRLFLFPNAISTMMSKTSV